MVDTWYYYIIHHNVMLILMGRDDRYMSSNSNSIPQWTCTDWHLAITQEDSCKLLIVAIATFLKCS